jgi:hypothetical protein
MLVPAAYFYLVADVALYAHRRCLIFRQSYQAFGQKARVLREESDEILGVAARREGV